MDKYEHTLYKRRALRCYTCPEGREQINGRWCTVLRRYVEHDERERCASS